MGADTPPLKVPSRIVHFLKGDLEGELIRFGDVISLLENIERVGNDYITQSSMKIFDKDDQLVIETPPYIKHSRTLDTIRGESWSIPQGDEIKRITNLTVEENGVVHVKVHQVYKDEVIEITSSYPVEDAYYDGFGFDGLKKVFNKATKAIQKGLEKVVDVVSKPFHDLVDKIVEAGEVVEKLATQLRNCVDEAEKKILGEKLTKARLELLKLQPLTAGMGGIRGGGH